MKCYYTRDLNHNVSLTIITTATTFAAVSSNDQHNIESATKPEKLYAVCEEKQKSRGSRTNWTTCTITIDIDIRRTTETVRYAAY